MYNTECHTHGCLFTEGHFDEDIRIIVLAGNGVFDSWSWSDILLKQ